VSLSVEHPEESLSDLVVEGERQYDPSGTPWRQFSLCRDHDADLWFPTATESDVAATTICRACPVRLDCLAWALKYNERYGIWGGVSARARQRMRAEARLRRTPEAGSLHE
jgi:WhiB family redox-sensing transcriptional regulator